MALGTSHERSAFVKQAKGILMARNGINANQAVELLKLAHNTHRTKTRGDRSKPHPNTRPPVSGNQKKPPTGGL